MENEFPVIDGKYEILARIGEGGMSQVYLARDKRLNKQWAIKELKTTGDHEKDAIIAQSFISEANLLKRLDHPFLPRIVDIINQDGTIYVVMDYIEGQSLEKVLKEHGAQPQESVIEWGLDLCEALDYLHTQDPPIIYRDMKPGNVMLRPDGTVRIIDFGIAREFKQPTPGKRLEDTTVLGTRGYAAPEQFGGIGQTDPRTDVYGLGATLHHLLTGSNPADPPYELYPIRQINPQLSPGLEKVISTCVQQNPAARYQSCAELYYALDNYEKADDKYFKRQRNKLKLFIAAAIVTVLLAIGGTIGLVGNKMIIANDYDAVLLRASVADNSNKAQYYLDAIDLVPGDLRAYRGLIDYYKEDGVLSATEYNQLNQVLVNNKRSLMANKDYPTFALEVGELYWYYSEVMDSSDVVLEQNSRAKPWFLDATQSNDPAVRKTAMTYYSLTSFVTDYYKDPSGTHEAGVYSGYYQNLMDLNQLLASEQSPIVKLRGCTTTLTAVEMYARNFKADGITEYQLEALARLSIKTLYSFDFNQDTSPDLYLQKQKIQNRENDILGAIQDAYWEKAQQDTNDVTIKPDTTGADTATDTSGTSSGKGTSGTSSATDTSGTSSGKDTSGTSSGKSASGTSSTTKTDGASSTTGTSGAKKGA